MQVSEASSARTDTKNILKGAVQQNALNKKQGVLEKLFCLWFDGMVYNQIWEDPVVDAEALQLGPDSKILTISSGGCNLLNYLAYDPAEIHAVDLNPNHMQLARLRLAAVRHLPDYPSLLQFFGAAEGSENLVAYEKYIRPHLDDEARHFWESPSMFRLGASRRIDFFSKNLYNYTRSGFFIRMLHWLCRLAKCSPEKILNASSLEEQRVLFERHLAPTFNHWIVRTFGKLPVMVYSLGIPPQQFTALKEDAESIVDVYRRRTERLACNFPVSENYFAWQAFARCYNLKEQAALPLYLQEEHYENIRSRVDRVTTNITTTTAFIQNAPEGSLNSFVFLDSQDWMTQQQVTDLWQAIARAGESGSRIIFRTAGSQSPIGELLPEELLREFNYHDTQSQELYEQDRSAVYGGFHIYERR